MGWLLVHEPTVVNILMMMMMMPMVLVLGQLEILDDKISLFGNNLFELLKV